MKKIASILLGILMLSAGRPLFGQTDTNFRKQGEEVFLFRTTQESKNHDSLKVTTEKLLAKWQIANDCRPLSLEDYKQLLKGQTVFKQDTNPKKIIVSILPVKEAYIINSTEHRLQADIVSAKKSSQTSPGKICWFWTILGIIIPVIFILPYGFFGLVDKKNRDFIIAYSLNLVTLLIALIYSFIAQPPSLFPWMFGSMAIIFLIYKISDWTWESYDFFQVLLLAGIGASWLVVHVLENPANRSGHLWAYLLAFVGLQALSFAIRISLRKLSHKVMKDFRG